MKAHGSSWRGLSLVEVLIALAIIGVAFTILSVALVGSLQNSERSGTRTQTTQYLNYLGRRVSGGDNAVLPTAGATLSWGYGTMGAAFPDLPTAVGGRSNVNQYRATVENVAAVNLVGATSVRYRVTVCTQSTTGEACVSGTTLGSPPYTDDPSGLLPGIN